MGPFVIHLFFSSFFVSSFPRFSSFFPPTVVGLFPRRGKGGPLAPFSPEGGKGAHWHPFPPYGGIVLSKPPSPPKGERAGKGKMKALFLLFLTSFFPFPPLSSALSRVLSPFGGKVYFLLPFPCPPKGEKKGEIGGLEEKTPTGEKEEKTGAWRKGKGQEGKGINCSQALSPRRGEIGGRKRKWS